MLIAVRRTRPFDILGLCVALGLADPVERQQRLGDHVRGFVIQRAVEMLPADPLAGHADEDHGLRSAGEFVHGHMLTPLGCFPRWP